jgi:hypothetical protein
VDVDGIDCESPEVEDTISPHNVLPLPEAVQSHWSLLGTSPPPRLPPFPPPVRNHPRFDLYNQKLHLMIHYLSLEETLIFLVLGILMAALHQRGPIMTIIILLGDLFRGFNDTFYYALLFVDL